MSLLDLTVQRVREALDSGKTVVRVLLHPLDMRKILLELDPAGEHFRLMPPQPGDTFMGILFNESTDVEVGQAVIVFADPAITRPAASQ